MIGIDTRRDLAQLFALIIDGERSIEVMRQELSNRYAFSPQSLFQSLANGTDCITARDIGTFVDRIGGNVQLHTLALLIKQYDTDNDNKLSYAEFMSLVLPVLSPALREDAQRREGYVNYDVEQAFMRLVERESFLQRDMEANRRSLAELPDFTLQAAFVAVDRFSKGSLDRDDFVAFIRRHGLGAAEPEVDGLVRRFDRVGNGEVSYSEFVDGILPTEPFFIQKLSSAGSRSRNVSPNVSANVSINRSLGSFRPEDITPNKFTSPRDDNADMISLLHSASHPRPQSPPSPTTKPLRSSILASSQRQSEVKRLTHSDSSELARLFAAQMDLQRQVETAKERLAIQADLNLPDLYYIFESRGQGAISVHSFEVVLTQFEIFPRPNETALLLKQYANGNLSTNFESFCQIFTPRNPNYARILQQRPSAHREQFSFDTIQALKKLMALHFEAENVAEDIRLRLSQSGTFNSLIAFDELDSDKNGYITMNEFERMLLKHGIQVSHEDLKLLMDRYDRNRDGKISYSDFAHEVNPRSPRTY